MQTELWLVDGIHSCQCPQYAGIRGRYLCRVQMKCDGTRYRTGGDVKGKLANGVGSQYPSHYLGTWCIQLHE